MILRNKFCYCIYTQSSEVSFLVDTWATALFSYSMFDLVRIAAQYLCNKCEMHARNDDMEIESGEFILL